MSGKFTARFVLKERNTETHSFNADLIIHNSSNEEIRNWKLCMNFFGPGETEPLTFTSDKNEEIEVLKRIGEYYELNGFTAIPASGDVLFKIKGVCPIIKYTDTPSCYYLVINDADIETVVGTCDLSLIETEKKNIQDKKSKILNNNSLRLIPAPSEYTINSGEVDFTAFNKIINLTDSKDAEDSIQSFFDSYTQLISHEFSFNKNNENSSHLIHIKNNSELSTDCYTLNINKSEIEIEANSRGGYLYALISLFKLADAYANKIPCLSINDAPRFTYRGNLLDVSRSFRTVEELKKYFRMMALCKVNAFHCRLTDDEGWRFEVKKYPNITNIGGFRGYGEIIPTHHGSGCEKVGGFYTHEEMLELVNYANSLNITFIPEIVVPSHSRALIESFTGYNGEENPLREKEDKSEHLSPQAFTDNILNPALEMTYEVLEAVYSELTSIFKVQKNRKMPFGDYIHIGVDEVPEGTWMKSPACKVLMKKHGLKTTEEIQFYFISIIHEMIEGFGFQVAGWEEIIKGGPCGEKNLLVYNWYKKEVGYQAAEDGFSIVMCPAPYLYFDLSYTDDINEPGIYWGGFVDAKQIYKYEPFNETCSDRAKKNIKGLQGCLWGESLGYPKINNLDKLPENYIACPHEYMAYPKMTSFSEVSWSSTENRNWDDFVEKFEYEKAILDKFDVKYRSNPL
ncbi:MAG: family 20 glycosylhydrolase [bacterium]|nr:family 20 glycosylhydrolase [bacterium]